MALHPITLTPAAKPLVAILLIACMFPMVGCNRGPERYTVTGQVVYDGKVVPVGRLVFTPDRTKGNTGPQGVAVIEDGQIVTKDERKVIGGPHWVQIMAYDGIPYKDFEGMVEQGRPLFPLAEAPLDLPKADAKIELKVAKSRGEPQVEVAVEKVE